MEYLDRANLKKNTKYFKERAKTVQKCIFEEVTTKFGFFLLIMTNFSDIEQSISASVGNLTVLKNAHKEIGAKIDIVREDITKRVRKKQKLNEI